MTFTETSQTRRRYPAGVHEGAVARVTVVILCYNYGHYLNAAVDSALSQAGVVVDVVIVDDKSTDDSEQAARQLARQHKETVRVIANATNLGLAETFNVGLSAAKGEFVVRIDADDLLTPGSLKRAVDVARAFPNVGLIYGHPLHFFGAVLPQARMHATYWTVWPGLEWLEDRCRDGHNVITSPEVMLRRSTMEKAGPVQVLPHTNDMEMWLRMAAHGDVAYVHGADQAWHREHPNSMSAREVTDYLDLQERKETFAVLFDSISGIVPDAGTYHRTALESLANEAVRAVNHDIDCGRGGSSSDKYLQFARDTALDLTRVSAWPGYQLRKRWAGSGVVSCIVGFGPRLVGAINGRLRWRRWHREGRF